MENVLDLSVNDISLGGKRSTRTRIVRHAPTRVTVFLDKKWMDALCADTESRLSICICDETQGVCVILADGIHFNGPKVYRNKSGSGRFTQTINDHALELIFPNGETIYCPSSVQLGKEGQQPYVNLGRREHRQHANGGIESLDRHSDTSAENEVDRSPDLLQDLRTSENQAVQL